MRGHAADVHDAADFFLYRDSSIAPLLDMRRRMISLFIVGMRLFGGGAIWLREDPVVHPYRWLLGLILCSLRPISSV